MSKTNFEKAFDISALNIKYDNNVKDVKNWVLDNEGNKISDNVGSKYGVSAMLYNFHTNRVPDKTTMATLSKEKAEEILKKQYWEKLNLENITDFDKQLILFDTSVKHGIASTMDIVKSITDGKDMLKKINEDKLFVSKVKEQRKSKFGEKDFDYLGGSKDYSIIIIIFLIIIVIGLAWVYTKMISGIATSIPTETIPSVETTPQVEVTNEMPTTENNQKI